LGGSAYRYEYSVYNDGSLGAGVPIELFDVLFDPALYQESSLQIVTPDPPKSEWSEQFLASLPGVPAAYDALALTGGIPDGSTVGGFAVEFIWLGPGLPGGQPFQIYSVDRFRPLETGGTVPEPSFLCVLALSLAYGARKIHLSRA
jgi:hypothetical protein